MQTELSELNDAELDQVSGGTDNNPTSTPNWLRDLQFKDFARAMFASTKGAGPVPS